MQGRGSVIYGIDIKLSIPLTETCDTSVFLEQASIAE